MIMFSRRREAKFKQWLKIGLYLLLVALIILSFAFWQLVKPANLKDTLVSFSITPGQDVKTIGLKLKESNLIKSRLVFESWVWLTGTEKKFVAGDYKLPANVNIINLTRLLTGSLALPNEVKVVIIEGWTIKDIASYLEKNNLYFTTDFIALVSKPQNFEPLLNNLGIKLTSKPANASLEGYLFPDTYRVYRDSQPDDLVAKMLNNFVDKFKPEWQQEITKRGYNMFQAVTLASIVEKEVANDKDRRLVADIFWRRLKVGRGLESDATINYITGKKALQPSLLDLAVDSPYNTYKYRGLPPGPICNPGASALEAVIYPQSNDYWYFLTTPDGEVIYSKTFEEHKAAKAKYLK